ncbi:mitochondrial 50S ribosomal protein L37, putative [Pediculus humanus corporis]|uniref:Large ribosomal subunit protein mL37 n=1 Tax=Pediculus humanus subsp. corporis TaxID=121224 RepID=E0VV23_PEDHC|nr:mitochondrial 50S ribosomal protein L37, putative [Pediculus humanus corporis]EEB17229.1 mitochondrial 50S ribosomal protein L37, putative [Pediculus humanus corporis]
MKFTDVLWAHNIYRIINRHWYIQGKLKVLPTNSEKVLNEYGFNVEDINTYLYSNKTKQKNEVSKLNQDLNSEVKPCFMYKDDQVLLEGLKQAKVLTNTIDYNELPEKIVELEKSFKLTEEVHSNVKRKILLSCLLESTQTKLPKRKDPLRPAWNFPRDYGISDDRKNELLCKNLMMACENYTKKKNCSTVYDTFFSVPFEAHGKQIQFEITSEILVTTSEKLKPITNPNLTFHENLPIIYPTHCTISLLPCKNYVMDNIYPLSMKSKYPFVQTAILHLNYSQMKKICDEITEEQILGRSLLKGFTIAAAQARAEYGNEISELPEPVVIPIVHTDGRMFHFSIYQLNTLNLDKETNLKNIFWSIPRIPLYDECQYKQGKPVLENYNSDTNNSQV